MNIIYSCEANWHKNWFRFELLMELSKLGHKVTYTAPQRIGGYLQNIYKKKAQRNIPFDFIDYQPYFRTSSKNRWTSELNAVLRIIENTLYATTVFISNDFKRCANVKDHFGDRITVVYDVYDRYSEFYSKNSKEIQEYDELEKNAILKCDLILCASKMLMEETGNINDSVLWFPNAVPADYIIAPSKAWTSSKTIGMLSDRMSRIDTELLIEIAKNIPDYRIELVGSNDLINQGREYPSNVFFVDFMPHHKLLNYITKWDCGFSLYNDDRFNFYCCPMKYFEYSSRNLPIISTPIPEAKIFASLYPDIIYLADDAQQFIQNVRKINAQREKGDFTKLACENNWGVRANQLIKSLIKMTVVLLTFLF